MTKYILLPLLFFVSFFSYSQTTGEAAWNYTQQTELNSFANQKETTICNSLVLTSICGNELTNIQPNQTINVDCVYDLTGQTIEIPAGVTFTFSPGGDIINGTLNFAAEGKIAGELLNVSLTIEGDVQLIEEEFEFIPSRWDIVQGKTSKEIALNNNTNLERLFYWTKELGANTFKIDKFDAYFEVTTVTSTTSDQNFRPSLESLNLPSDFNLVMTDNTHLRVYPYAIDSDGNGSLLGIREVENVTITGGNLHGDRYEYYVPDFGEDGNRLLTIRSGKNITIDNIYIENSSIQAIAINSQGFSFNPDYDPTENVVIKNSTLFNNRGLSLAITDGRNITIENNEFIDSSQPTDHSDGGVVGYAIDVEPVRDRDPETGELIEYQKVFDVLITGNTERNSREGFLILFVGEDVIVENNFITTRVAWTLMSGAKVRNNTFDATNSWASESWAFTAGGEGETVSDNEFNGNTITGYSIGIDVGSEDADIFDNIITNVSTGIQVNNAFNAKIYDNTIEAENRGIYIGNTTANNVEITGNIIDSGLDSVQISAVNEEHEGHHILIDDNNIKSGRVSLFRANGITFSNNEVNGGISIAGDVSNSIIDKNTIIPNDIDGIRLRNTHENITVSNNIITEPTNDNFQCLNNISLTPLQVTLINNTCE